MAINLKKNKVDKTNESDKPVEKTPSKFSGKFDGIKNLVSTNKKSSVIIGILVGAILVVSIGTGVAVKILNDKNEYVVNYTAAYGREISKLRATNNEFDEYYTNDNTEREYVGTKIDVDKWGSHDKMFMEFIRPAFEYANGNEYMEHRYHFIEQLGESKFTTLVMTPLASYTNEDTRNTVYYASSLAVVDGTGQISQVAAENACEKTHCTLSSGWFKSYPVDVLSTDGSYSYIAIINTAPVGASGNNNNAAYIAKYTITSGGELRDFECWPNR